MVERVIHLFQTIGIEDIVVVTGHNREILEPIVYKAGAAAVFNDEFEAGMFRSIQKGVADVSAGSRGFFLLPADIPLVRPGTLIELMKRFECHPEQAIIPRFEGETGHPPLIPSAWIPTILSAGEDMHMGKILLSRQEAVTELPVHDRGILMDADTGDAWHQVTEKFRHWDIPDKQECWSLIHHFLPGEKSIHAHLARVAQVAGKLGRSTAGLPGAAVDEALLSSAALLHDIRRKEENHAKAGADLLSGMGFHRTAAVVETHMTLDPGEVITEKEILFFADKLCHGDRLDLDYENRFRLKIETYPQAEKWILHRYETCRQIQARIEAITGRSIRSLLA